MKINYPAVLVAALAHFVVGGLWYGLIFTNKFIELIFEERKLGLYLLNIGYQFFGCAIAGMILAVWKTREAKEAAAQPA